MKQARVHPAIRPWIKNLTITHESYSIDRVHHRGIVFPWHRLVLFLLETLIRKKIDCHFTMPYYDPTKHWNDWWHHSPWDSTHLGGDGKGKDCCVRDGPFRKYQWRTLFPRGVAPTCLKRHFNKKSPMPSGKVLSFLVKIMKAQEFSKFELGFNHYVHDKVHHLVGGYVHYGTSINDPMFWVFHSFVDKVFTTWQWLGQDYLETPFGSMDVPIENQPSGLNFTYAEMSDNSNLPHNAAVCYTSSNVDSVEDGQPYFVPGSKDVHQWNLEQNVTVAQLIESMSADEIREMYHLLSLLSHQQQNYPWLDTQRSDCLYHKHIGPRLHAAALKDGLISK